jgi:hypothetical protein
MFTVEATPAGRRFFLPDSLRTVLLERTTDDDLLEVAEALRATGAPASPSGGASATVVVLATALAEIENVFAVLEALSTAEAHHPRLQLAMAYRTPWLEDGHWARGVEEILGALHASDAVAPLDPVARAEVVAGVFDVAGSFDAFARLVDLAGPAAAVAEEAGRLDLVVALRYAEAAGFGYFGRRREAAAAVVAVRRAADRSRLEPLLLRADGLDALAMHASGAPGEAHDRFVPLAERCRELGWLGTGSRVRMMASQAARAAGDPTAALLDARVAEEMASAGLARASLAWARAEIADLELQRAEGAGGSGDVSRARAALQAALEVAVPSGQLRQAGICRLRLALLDDDVGSMAQAALELLQADGRSAALALAHVLPRVGDASPLHRLVPRALAVLAAGGGSPLPAPDEELVTALADATGPPDAAWRDAVIAELTDVAAGESRVA